MVSVMYCDVGPLIIYSVVILIHLISRKLFCGSMDVHC